MKIEDICTILKESGLTRAIITIDTNNDDVVTILNVPTASISDANKAHTNIALKAAVAKPLFVNGKVAEIDGLFDAKIASFADKLEVGMINLNKSTAKNLVKPKAKATETPTAKPTAKKEAVKVNAPTPKETAIEEAKVAISDDGNSTNTSGNFDMFTDPSFSL